MMSTATPPGLSTPELAQGERNLVRIEVFEIVRRPDCVHRIARHARHVGHAGHDVRRHRRVDIQPHFFPLRSTELGRQGPGIEGPTPHVQHRSLRAGRRRRWLGRGLLVPLFRANPMVPVSGAWRNCLRLAALPANVAQNVREIRGKSFPVTKGRGSHPFPQATTKRRQSRQVPSQGYGQFHVLFLIVGNRLRKPHVRQVA